MEAYSSGSKPSGIVNPKAIISMQEVGYDLSSHGSIGLDAIPQVNYEYAITMGCGDECPFVSANFREDWALPDPKNMDEKDFNDVRDQIEQRVIDLIGKLS